MEKDFYRRYYEIEGRHWWFVGRRTILLRLLRRALPDRSQPRRVMDFGCGTGAFLGELEAFGSVSAVDSDPDAVAFCHERGRGEVLQIESGAPLPFEADTFDLITALDVIEHIEDDVAALSELRRVMKPDAVLLVAVPAFPFLWGDQDEVSHHHRRYTNRTLGQALTAAGLEVEHASYFNTILFPAIAAIRLTRRLIRPPRAERTDFDIGPAWLNGLLARLLAAEAGLVSRARVPFGVSIAAIARVG